MNVQRLKREIEQQTRNGRNSIYISVSDLEELQGIKTQSNGRIYIDVSELEELIYEYEKKSFKNGLKVNYVPEVQTKASIEARFFKGKDIEKIRG